MVHDTKWTDLIRIFLCVVKRIVWKHFGFDIDFDEK